MLDNGLPLLPAKFKPAGLAAAAAGLIFFITRFYFGVKLSFLEIKVFAIYSSYLQSRYFEWITNNMGEEVPALLIYAGLMIVVFSKEKFETPETNILRYQSITAALLLNGVFIIISILFFFGFAFVDMLILNIIFLPSAYLAIFNLRLKKLKKVPTL